MDRQLSPADRPAIPPYQQRVFEEAAELSGRIERLRAFMHREEFAMVPVLERTLLRMQEGQMAALLATLRARIGLFIEQGRAQAGGNGHSHAIASHAIANQGLSQAHNINQAKEPT